MAENHNISLNVNPNGGLDSRSIFPEYTPLRAVEYGALSVGAAAPVFSFRNTMSNERSSYGGGKCIRLLTLPTVPGSVCGGHFFAGRMTLSTPVPLGNIIWQRMRFYFPAAFSFGAAYYSGSPSSPAGDGCGASADGGLQGTKWLVFSPNSGTARTYLLIPNALRAVNQTPGSGFLSMEADPTAQQALNVVFPRDQWITLELAIKVSNTGTGWARAWLDGQLIAQALNVNTVAGGVTSITEYGVGDYWNGTPWSDGGADRDEFFIDDIVVASDVAGYGAPDATDAAGNLMIGTEVTVRDF
jgi:hypothetical protein